MILLHHIHLRLNHWSCGNLIDHLTLSITKILKIGLVLVLCNWCHHGTSSHLTLTHLILLRVHHWRLGLHHWSLRSHHHLIIKRALIALEKRHRHLNPGHLVWTHLSPAHWHRISYHSELLCLRKVCKWWLKWTHLGKRLISKLICTRTSFWRFMFKSFWKSVWSNCTSYSC